MTTEQFRDISLFGAPQAITNPCTGEPGMLDAIAHTGVFHTTSFTTGTGFWLTTTAEGTATFTPTDPNGVTASGHFAEWPTEVAWGIHQQQERSRARHQHVPTEGL